MKILVLDQDNSVINSLENFLEMNPKLVNSFSFVRDIKEASKHIHTFHPNILFIDISEDESNLEVLNYINSHDIKIVWMSNNALHAIKAINISAFDFLMKPVCLEDFQRIILKAKTVQTVKHRMDLDEHNVMVVQTKNGHVTVELEKVMKIKASGSYSSIHISNNKQFLVCKVLGFYENRLPKNDFFRIHHSCIINKNFIESYKVDRSCILYLKDGNQEMVSQRRKSEFLRFIQAQ